MSIRKEFVLRVMARESTVTELCRRYGISRKTGYKWIARFKQSGVAGLVDESRRPRTSPASTTPEMAEAIIQLRQEHWSWGARKLHRLLVRIHGDAAPAIATVARVLERAGLVRRNRRRPAPKGLPAHRPNAIVEAPNDLWTVDFKGWWRTRDGTRCDPLTVRDAFSRFVHDVRLVTDMKALTVRRVFEQLFARYGVPKAIQSDNGQPFASTTGIAGLTKLSAWWVSLGIELVRSRPGCPQDNGAHERMHADLRREIEAIAASTLIEQQSACDAWRTEFNHVRPHEALAMRTPSEVYRPSARRPLIRVGGWPLDCERRVVDNRGWLRFDMLNVYVAYALAGYPVGIRRDGQTITVWFYDQPIGRFRFGVDRSLQPILASSAKKDAIVPIAPGLQGDASGNRLSPGL